MVPLVDRNWPGQIWRYRTLEMKCVTVGKRVLISASVYFNLQLFWFWLNICDGLHTLKSWGWSDWETESEVQAQRFPFSSVSLISAERCRKAVPLWTRFDLAQYRTIHHFDCPVLGMYLAGSGYPWVSPRSPCRCESRANLDTTKTFRSR